MIVRARNEAGQIYVALASVREQGVLAELIVVDSGSTDGTLEIASRFADRVIRIPSEEFTYGHALNVGAAAASAPVHVALSAHCALPHPDWIQTAVAHYERPDVAATEGDVYLPGGEPIDGVFFQDAKHFRAHPRWGVSNHGATWRASIWERFPFNETLLYAEDKEWAWRVLADEWVIACDPTLRVDMSHQWNQGRREIFDRGRRCAIAYSQFCPVPTDDPRTLLAEWWGDMARPNGFRLRRGLDFMRLSDYAGRLAGYRSSRRSARDANR